MSVDTIGIRELRDGLSRHLAEVREGGEIIVTDHGKPIARIVPFGISPTISTYLMQTVSLTLPLFIGGGLQLLNDVAFFLMFRHVRPPEELAMNEKSIIEELSG